jgi:hypothetical protein
MMSSYDTSIVWGFGGKRKRTSRAGVVSAAHNNMLVRLFVLLPPPHQVARERFGDALWAVRACEPLYTASQTHKRKRKTVDFAAPVLANADDVREREARVTRDARKLGRIRRAIGELEAKAKRAKQRMARDIPLLVHDDQAAYKALRKFDLDLEKLKPPAPVPLVADPVAHA